MVGHRLHFERVGEVFDDHTELVATQKSRDFRPPDALGERPSHRPQQFVATGVADAVIGRFDVVQIVEQCSDAFAVTLGLLQRIAQPIEDQCPLSESGERNMKCLIGELILGPFPIWNVVSGDHVVADGRTVDQVADAQFERYRECLPDL